MQTPSLPVGWYSNAPYRLPPLSDYTTKQTQGVTNATPRKQ